MLRPPCSPELSEARPEKRREAQRSPERPREVPIKVSRVINKIADELNHVGASLVPRRLTSLVQKTLMSSKSGCWHKSDHKKHSNRFTLLSLLSSLLFGPPR